MHSLFKPFCFIAFNSIIITVGIAIIIMRLLNTTVDQVAYTLFLLLRGICSLYIYEINA